MRAVVTAGGTGGHIYPALAIIKKIKEEEPNSEFLYIGTHNRMEKDIVPKYKIRYIPLEVTGFKRKFTLDNIKSLTNFLKARRDCKKIISEFNPDVVIGCGGYVSAPVIWAASKLGKKTFIHEQNSVVGLANKYLSKYADKIGVSFASTLDAFPKEKVVLTGNPCREKALSLPKVELDTLGLSKDKKTVLIVMGSLGSRSVNDKIMSFIEAFRNKDYQVLFITGNDYYEKVKTRILPSNVVIKPFINDLSAVMKSVDLIVSRSGASTISEITALALPPIFIPSPFVTNNHQYKNAMDLVEKNAGYLIEEDKLTKNNLLNLIDKLFNDEKKYNEIKKNVSSFAIKNSSSLIYENLKEMIMNDKRFF